MHDVVTAVFGGLAGLSSGYLLSRICWVRSVNDRLARLETKLEGIAEHLARLG